MNEAGKRIKEEVSAAEIKADGIKTMVNVSRIFGALAAAALLIGVVSTDARLNHENEGYSDLSFGDRAGFVVDQMSANAAQAMTGDADGGTDISARIHHAVQKQVVHHHFLK